MPAKKTKTVKKVKNVVAKKNIAKKTSVKAVVKKVAKKAKIVAKAPTKKVSTSPKNRETIKAEVKVATAKPAKSIDLNVPVFGMQGKTAGKIKLPSEIFGAKINGALMSQAVRVYLANQRQGTSKTKDRGEVNRTTKKIYQQKGTGRARHGSRRAPIFVGGGRVFGPTPRDLSLGFSRKMKTLALFSALSSKLKDSEIKIIEGLGTISPKTKIMVQVLKSLEIKNSAKVLLVMPKAGKESENVYRAGRNIEGVEILSANSLNAYKVLDNSLVLLMKDSIDSLKNTFISSKK
jgi:large subunit ribosomal protein L4